MKKVCEIGRKDKNELEKNKERVFGALFHQWCWNQSIFYYGLTCQIELSICILFHKLTSLPNESFPPPSSKEKVNGVLSSASGTPSILLLVILVLHSKTLSS